jgi:phosphopantothenoylcysteine decarboxylase/phosphopantothenate--cysteine ligase
VRFIGNYSSGKQGIAIAETLRSLGADVLLVAGNVTEEINLPKENIIRVKTADEMLSTINNNLNGVDIFISSAAVADFKPKNFIAQKIKKSAKNTSKTIELVENIDILKTIGNSNNRPKIVVGFAAESEDLLENAQGKLKTKNCDLIVANNVENGAVFGSSYNKVAFLHKKGTIKQLKTLTKVEVAELLAQEISLML